MPTYLTWNFIFNCKTADKTEKQFAQLTLTSGLPFEIISSKPYHQGGFEVKAKTLIAETEKAKVVLETLRHIHRVSHRWYVGCCEYENNEVDFQGTTSGPGVSHIPGLTFIGFGLMYREQQ